MTPVIQAVTLDLHHWIGGHFPHGFADSESFGQTRRRPSIHGEGAKYVRGASQGRPLSAALGTRLKRVGPKIRAIWNVTDWRGKMIVNRDGEMIGKLQDVCIDVVTYEPQFRTVNEGSLDTRDHCYGPPLLPGGY